MSEDATAAGDEAPPQLSFKVKTSANGLHNITMPETSSVKDLKTKLAGADFEDVPVERQRLIYSGRVMKDDDSLSTYKIKPGNTVHMVKSAASNATNTASTGGGASSAPRSATASTGVPTNMAAGTANNPLAGLTGARYAGHIGLPGREMFGADGGMGAPPSEDQMADMLSDPATAQMMNEALNNPQMIEMMIQSNPQLRQMGPAAREMLQSPMFRRMMTDPNMLRQAAQMQRQMQGAGASSFPAPGATDTTPEGAAASNTARGSAPPNPFASLGAGAGGNPFAQLFGPGGFGGMGQTPAQSPPLPGSAGQSTPSTGADANANTPAANPFASMFGGEGGANPFGMPPPSREQLEQAMNFLRMGGMGGAGGLGGADLFGGGFGTGASSPPPPADSRPPEELYAEQLRQLNDMGFHNFEQNVQALRRSGGNVQGAVNQLLG